MQPTSISQYASSTFNKMSFILAQNFFFQGFNSFEI
jgi:hypothetical protein